MRLVRGGILDVTHQITLYVMWNATRSDLDCLLLYQFHCATLNPLPPPPRLLESAQTSEIKLRRCRCRRSKTGQHGSLAARGVTQKFLPQEPHAEFPHRNKHITSFTAMPADFRERLRPHSRPITTCVAWSPRKNTVAFSVTDGLGPRCAVSVKLRCLSGPAPNAASVSSRGLTSRNRW